MGDPLYGGRPRPPKGASEAFINTLRGFDRQALHATMLRLYHRSAASRWVACAAAAGHVDLINALKADTEKFKDQMDW